MLRGTSQASGSSLGCRLTDTTSDKGFPDVAQLPHTQSAPEADSNFLCMYLFPLHQKHFLLKAGGRSVKSQEVMKRTRHRLLSWVELSFVISSLPDSPPGKPHATSSNSSQNSHHGEQHELVKGLKPDPPTQSFSSSPDA